MGLTEIRFRHACASPSKFRNGRALFRSRSSFRIGLRAPCMPV